MKLHEIYETTSAGGIATFVQPMTKKVIKRAGPIEKKSGNIVVGKGIYEGEERSIIHDGCVDKLVDEFRGEEHQFENMGDLEYAIYSELERLDVEDCVDPDMEHGGQRMGDFASGGVLNVIDSSSVIDDVVAQLDVSELEEGKSPHKKGTKKYKKHMAAMHAGG
jgi:hypothetical protein